jgi:hypothetical protein
MDGSNLATMGMTMAYSDDWERGCSLVESALQLNPHHPGLLVGPLLQRVPRRPYHGALKPAVRSIGWMQ